jgi:AcrR family transcriptional regulator
MPDDADRRTAIADAAIEIISRSGIRALTHRAIDQHLGLSGGSTSYYVRTRRALLQSVVVRLAERTTSDLRSAGGPGPQAGSARHHDDLPGQLDAWSLTAGVVLDRMIGVRRADSLARYALTLELATDPELHRMLTAGTPIRARAEADLRRLGVADPAAQAADLVSLADGLVFDRLAGTRSFAAPKAGSAASVDELSGAIRTFLRGVFGV